MVVSPVIKCGVPYAIFPTVCSILFLLSDNRPLVGTLFLLMQSICVFCGANSGTDPVYVQATEAAGQYLAQRGIRLVYGGGNVGLMGVLADAALAHGGWVTGVIPHFLAQWEVAHRNLSELIFTETMHERKARMAELSEGFVALPGGFGTLDELFEILTWAQLGIHQKPIGLLNVGGYFDPLLTLIDAMVERGFLKPANRALLHVGNDLGALLETMHTPQPAFTTKWVDSEKI
jgi:uncharacterized protein (TIGR00730 family)